MTSIMIFDAIKARYNLPSDYALSKLLGLTQSSLSLHRKHPRSLSDKVCLRAAELLQLPPEYVLFCAQAERAQSDIVSRLWLALSDNLMMEFTKRKQRLERGIERRASTRISA